MMFVTVVSGTTCRRNIGYLAQNEASSLLRTVRSFTSFVTENVAFLFCSFLSLLTEGVCKTYKVPSLPEHELRFRKLPKYLLIATYISKVIKLQCEAFSCDVVFLHSNFLDHITAVFMFSLAIVFLNPKVKIKSISKLTNPASFSTRCPKHAVSRGRGAGTDWVPAGWKGQRERRKMPEKNRAMKDTKQKKHCITTLSNCLNL